MMRTGLIVSAICIALMIGISIWAALQLPQDNIPVHWNADGVADRFSDRNGAQLMLALLPGMSLLFAALLAVLPQIEPMRNNLLQSRKAYTVTWVSSMILFLAIHIGLVLLMLRMGQTEIGSDEFSRYIIVGSGVLLVIFGNYLPKTRQNWILGIRTPWTLSSEYTWEKTQRFAGRLFILAGVTIMICALLLRGIALAFVLGGAGIGVALVSAIYSFFIWRNAPDKRVGPEYIV